MWEIVAITVLLAFAFTFTNGFQDASSIAATFIASRSATPKAGILLVTSMSFLGAILGGSAVAFTLTGLVLLPSGDKTLTVLMISLLTASSWNLVTWRFLLYGTGCISWGVRNINKDKDAVEEEIRHAREAYNKMEELYISGMADLFRTNDAMHALRTREIYHHLRDAGRAMRDTLDVLHNAVIDLA